jgi:hypothetical protein
VEHEQQQGTDEEGPKDPTVWVPVMSPREPVPVMPTPVGLAVPAVFAVLPILPLVMVVVLDGPFPLDLVVVMLLHRVGVATGFGVVTRGVFELRVTLRRRKLTLPRVRFQPFPPSDTHRAPTVLRVLTAVAGHGRRHSSR